MPNKISTDIALLVFLMMIVAVVIFPILGNMPPSEQELVMLDRILCANNAMPITDIFEGGNNIFVETYLHLTLLLHGLLPMLDDLFLLRLPGALTVVALTLCLFRFGGNIDRYGSSFLASLIFLSSALVMRMTFNASVVMVPAALFIFALMSLYHWLNSQGDKRMFWLVVFSTTVATVQIGATAPISLALMAYVFLLASHKWSARPFFAITLALLLACCAAFMMIYALTGNKEVAESIFDIRQQLTVSPASLSMTHIFVNYVVFAIFPWSLPLIISLPWVMRNPRRIYRNFLDLTLLQRYSIIIFLFSLPFFFFVTDLTLILLIASMFFNMPLIGRYILRQFAYHHTIWKVAGYAFAVIAALFVVAFVALQLGWVRDVVGYEVSLLEKGNAWSAVLVAAVVFGIYSLWRNAREMDGNNRFMYNIIFIYISAALIYAGFVEGKLAF